MKHRLILLLCLLAASLANGASAFRYTLTVTVTNPPVTSNTLTIGSSTRIWTNASASGYIATNLTGAGPSTTNLANQLASFPLTGPYGFQWVSTNSFRLIGPLGATIAASSVGTWVTLTTNVQASPETFTAIWPLENMPGDATNRTNQASSLVYGLGQYSTNAFPTNSTAGSNFLTKGASPLQVVSSPVQFASLAGSVLRLTNGFTSATTNINPVSSNLVNYGNAIRSEGPGGNSFQAGSNAMALGANSIALGNGSLATGSVAMAIGVSAVASNQSATAVGNGAQALTNNATAIGQGAVASGNSSIAVGLAQAVADTAIAIGTDDTTANKPDAIAIGALATATANGAVAIGAGASGGHSNSVALGFGATTTTTNQVRLGTASETVSIAGQLLISGSQSNTTFRGTNVINGTVGYTSRAITSLVNGNNGPINLGTNTILRLSGATTIAALCSFEAAEDGAWKKVVVAGSITNIVANESGFDGTVSRRILTGTGGDVAFTNNPITLEFWYDATASRWRLANLYR